MSSKEEIFNKIQKTLQNRLSHTHQVKQASENIKHGQDIYKDFIENLKLNKTQVISCKKEEIAKHIEEITKELNTKNLLYDTNLSLKINKLTNVNAIPYKNSVNEMHETLFKCDTSIIKAKLGVSNIGIFCVTSHEQPRLMSLLPQNCIVLLKKEDIVLSMNDAYEVLQKEGNLPTNILFIAGPSRTADIELQVVLGVHGPQKVYVIVY